jgi:hypothetical protein
VFVSFWRVADDAFSVWEADRGHRRIVPGTVWKEGPWGLPHDLAGLVVEATLGRQIIQVHRAELNAAEGAVHRSITEWQAGRQTPAGQALDRFRGEWAELPAGMRLRVRWPTLESQIEQLPDAGRRHRRGFVSAHSH